MRTRPDVLKTIELPDASVQVDEFGYLVNSDEWSPAFAEYAATAEGIVLTPAHWEILDFMRAYLDAHGITADVRFVLKQISADSGLDKSGAKARLLQLFPYGYVKQACKIAGMKQPRAWSTG